MTVDGQFPLFLALPTSGYFGVFPISDGGDVRAPTPDHHRSL